MRHRPSKVAIFVLTALLTTCAQNAVELVEDAIKAARAATAAADAVKLIREGEALAKSGELAAAATKFEEGAAAEKAVGGIERAVRLNRVAQLLRAESLAKQGKLEEAANLFDEVATASKDNAQAGELHNIAENLRRQAWRQELARFNAIRVPPPGKSTISDAPAHSLGSALAKLSAGQAEVFRSIENVSPRVRSVSFVDSNVKRFVKDFVVGAGRPEDYLTERYVLNPQLLKQWKDAPVSRRIFVAGTKQDSTLVLALKKDLESRGYVVFFYEFCTNVSGQLCKSEVVGAFFRTSGDAVLADTPMASKSRYVPHEITTAMRLKNGESLLVMITPTDVAKANGTVKFAAVVANMPVEQ